MNFEKNNYYHIFNRGCNKDIIFFNEGNYLYLVRKMKKTYKKFGVNIIAYCLIPDHYHFLVQQKSEIPLSDWIKTLFIGYTQAVNIQQKRKGTLFEGRAKHLLIDKDNYLIHLMRYVHYNPVAAGLVAKPEDWKYSNYPECIGERNGEMYDKEFILESFGSQEEYRKFMTEYEINKEMIKKLEKYLIK